jgi:hypothetical protein
MPQPVPPLELKLITIPELRLKTEHDHLTVPGLVLIQTGYQCYDEYRYSTKIRTIRFFYGFCLVRKSVPKPKLHRALTPREKDVLKQVRALNDPLIIEAINLFNAEVQDVIRVCTAEEEARLGRIS